MASHHALSLRQVVLAEALELSASFSDLRYTQHPAYAAEAAARVGATCEFWLAEGNGAPRCFAAVRVKGIPLLGGGLAYVHGGPATIARGGAFDPDLWAQCLRLLAAEYRARGMMLRISSPLEGGADAALADSYRACGFVPARQAAGRTIMLDLRPGAVELEAGLHRKWRDDLRRARKCGLAISCTSDPREIAAAQPLLSRLSARKQFSVPMDMLFYGRVAEHAGGRGGKAFVLHSARHNGELVAFHLGSFTGESATYLLGAATAQGRETRAAYALQWAAIEYAQRCGMVSYDLGGIDPAGNPGTYRFKARMGGAETDRAIVWERPGAWLPTQLVRLAERMR